VGKFALSSRDPFCWPAERAGLSAEALREVEGAKADGDPDPNSTGPIWIASSSSSGRTPRHDKLTRLPGENRPDLAPSSSARAVRH